MPVLIAGCLLAPSSVQPSQLIAQRILNNGKFGSLTAQQLQQTSIQQRREICAYIQTSDVFDQSSGESRFEFTAPQSGSASGCQPVKFANNPPLASFHTHGHYLPNAISEIPSSIDFHADQRQGIDGFVVTPGGRLWWVQPALNRVTMLCDLGCLPSDPAWQPGFGEPFKRTYSLPELLALESAFFSTGSAVH